MNNASCQFFNLFNFVITRYRLFKLSTRFSSRVFNFGCARDCSTLRRVFSENTSRILLASMTVRVIGTRGVFFFVGSKPRGMKSGDRRGCTQNTTKGEWLHVKQPPPSSFSCLRLVLSLLSLSLSRSLIYSPRHRKALFLYTLLFLLPTQYTRKHRHFSQSVCASEYIHVYFFSNR